MNNVRTFRMENNIRQEDLATYLGVSRSFIAQVETGRCRLSEFHMDKLDVNDRGWNTSSLHREAVPNIITSVDNNSTARVSVSKGGTSVHELVSLQAQLAAATAMVDSLKEQLAIERQRNDKLMDMLQKMMK